MDISRSWIREIHFEPMLLERGHGPLVTGKTSDSSDTHEISRVLKSANLSLLYVVSTERGIVPYGASRRVPWYAALARRDGAWQTTRGCYFQCTRCCQSDVTQWGREGKGWKEHCGARLEKKRGWRLEYMMRGKK